MLERNFSSQFRKEYKTRYPEAHVQLLQDAPKGGKKPYDAYILDRAVFVAIEFKVEGGASIKSASLKQHQYDSLMNASNASGEAWVVILCEKIKKVFCIHILEWKAMFANEHLVKFEDVTWGFFIGRAKYDGSTTWDMKAFMQESVGEIF